MRYGTVGPDPTTVSHQVRATTRSSLLDRVWADLHGDPLLTGLVGVTGDTGLDSVLDVEGLALAAVGAQLLAAAELTARGRPVARAALDAPHIGVSFRSERFLRVDGRPAGAGFAPLSRFHRAVDGWVRLHANYPWHRRAAPAALGADPAAAIGERNALEVENAVVAAPPPGPPWSRRAGPRFEPQHSGPRPPRAAPSPGDRSSTCTESAPRAHDGAR